MKLGIILSNDWELFGDGSGNYFEIQHRPLEDLLKTIEKYDAKLTVMAEVGQQWAHHRMMDREPWARNVVEAWESILKDTVKRGHDVQLHLHPQWLNAEYRNNRWRVDLSKWAVSSLPNETMANIFKEGKLYLEKILKPVAPSYECIAFRAGAYCMQPSNVVIGNLRKSGIVCDTSVTKGMYNKGFFDYRDAYSNCFPWFVDDDNIAYKKNNNGSGKVLEIPIHSYRILDFPILRDFISPWLYYLISCSTWLEQRDTKWLIERSKTEYRRYSVRDRPFMITKKIASIRWLLSKLVGLAPMQLDYDVLPPKVFARRIEKLFDDKTIQEYENQEIIIPIMASGHVKRIHNCRNIDYILNDIRARLGNKIIFWTLHDAVGYWINRETRVS